MRRLHMGGGGTYATVEEARSLKGDQWSGFSGPRQKSDLQMTKCDSPATCLHSTRRVRVPAVPHGAKAVLLHHQARTAIVSIYLQHAEQCHCLPDMLTIARQRRVVLRGIEKGIRRLAAKHAQ
ncbi:hypothetical protein L1887_62640 [Cichorium endivia]|nr:hypothetical protein L1887_62640 [Cichorium endivia]